MEHDKQDPGEPYSDVLVPPAVLQETRSRAIAHVKQLQAQVEQSGVRMEPETRFLTYLLNQLEKLEGQGMLLGPGEVNPQQEQARKALAFLNLLSLQNDWGNLCHLYVPYTLLQQIDSVKYVTEQAAGVQPPRFTQPKTLTLPQHLEEVLRSLTRLQLHVDPVKVEKEGVREGDIQAKEVTVADLPRYIKRLEIALAKVKPQPNTVGGAARDAEEEHKRAILVGALQALREKVAAPKSSKLPVGFLGKKRIMLYLLGTQDLGPEGTKLAFPTLQLAEEWLSYCNRGGLSPAQIDSLLHQIKRIGCHQCSQVHGTFIQVIQVRIPDGQGGDSLRALALTVLSLSPLTPSKTEELQQTIATHAQELFSQELLDVKMVPFQCDEDTSDFTNPSTCRHGYLWLVQGRQNLTSSLDKERSLLVAAKRLAC